jgi:PAS domain S-box-containing protein
VLALEAFAVLCLVLLDPLTWGYSDPVMWVPGAGLAIALVAWLGPRSGLLLLLAATVVVLFQTFLRALSLGWPELLVLPGLVLDRMFGVLSWPLAWWLFQTRAHGSRRLQDPQSTTLFLLLVPGAVLGGFSLVQVLLTSLLEGPGGLLPLVVRWAQVWMERALGVLIVAPPLLVNVTPWLVRHGLILPESPDLSRRASDPYRLAPEVVPLVTSSKWGDWIEILGLTCGATILGLLMIRLQHWRELLTWQMWGVLLLLIVWASLRQGVRGGTLAASLAAAAPLLLAPFSSLGRTDLSDTGSLEGPLFVLLLQGHLAAQCGAALLVSAATSWVRSSETGYRRVVSHIPVVIYSARLREPLSSTAGPRSSGGLERSNQNGLGVAEITLVSAACQQLLGFPPEQLLGDYSRWLGCVHPDDREVLLAALAQLHRQTEPVTCEYRLAGGETTPRRAPPSSSSAFLGPPVVVEPPPARWLRDTLAPTHDHDGRLLGWEGVVTDITQQRALADDLRRTTNMLHALVANLPTGVFFVVEPNGRPILVNARARQLLGQREDSAAGLEYLSKVYRLFRTDGTLYPVEELPVFQALRNGRTTMRDDIVVHRPDGRRMPLVTWAAPVQLGGQGVPDAAVWVLEDLTALHQAEAARQDSEGRLRAVIETMAEGLIVQDRRGVIVEGNPAACSLLGLPIEQLRGRSLFGADWVFLREDGAPLPQEEHPTRVALRTGQPVRNFVLGVRSANQVEDDPTSEEIRVGVVLIRWVLVNAMPLGPGASPVWSEQIPRPLSPPSGVVTTLADITAYIQAREAIRSSEEKYRGLVESLPLILVQLDRNLRVIYANPAHRAITGYTREEIEDPDAWIQMIHPEDRARVHEIAQANLAGQSGRMELRYRARDGTERVSLAISEPRMQEGIVIGVTALLVDMTRERRLEQELLRSQRLELIGRLSSGVAHDFNNMLTVVLSLADLARGHLPPDHPVHADLHRITEAGEQAVGLASQLLALSRNRNNATQRIELHSIVQRTLELLRSTHRSRLNIQTELAEGELTIQGDPTQVQQVLMNLCLNARDAMAEGGTLGIRTATACCDGRGYVVLSVSDTGRGMTEQVRKRIFEPFFSTKESGTGLGLAVVQQIVDRAGGRIEVASQVGVGSRFEVWWPAE